MSKFSSLTENRYSLNDIFKKHYKFWCALPAFIYLIVPIIHLIVFTILGGKNKLVDLDVDEILHLLSTSELPGDYFIPMIHYSFIIVTIIAFVAYFSAKSATKSYSLFRKPDSVPMIFFAAYILFIVATTVWNGISYDLLLGFTTRGEGILSIFIYYLVFFLCSSYVEKENIKKAIIYLFLLTGIVIAIISIIDEFFFPVYIIAENGVCGIFWHWNFYGYYLSITIPLAAAMLIFEKKLKAKIFFGFTFVLNTFVLALNDTMGAFLACIVALLFVIVAASIKNKKFCLTGLVLLVSYFLIIFVTGLFTPSFFSELFDLGSDIAKIATDAEDAGSAGTGRWNLWVHTVQYIKEKPWLGWGYEGWEERLNIDTGDGKPHNEYLESMANFGIPAGLTYIAALMSVYIKAWKRREHVDAVSICCLAGALGYIASAFFGNSFIFTAPYMLIFLGLGSTTVHNPDIKDLELAKSEAENEELEIAESESSESSEDESANTKSEESETSAELETESVSEPEAESAELENTEVASSSDSDNDSEAIDSVETVD